MVCDPVSREQAQLALIQTLDPRIIERVRRLEMAIRLIRGGMSPADTRLTLRQTFGINQMHAWRVVDMAMDLVG